MNVNRSTHENNLTPRQFLLPAMLAGIAKDKSYNNDTARTRRRKLRAAMRSQQQEQPSTNGASGKLWGGRFTGTAHRPTAIP